MTNGREFDQPAAYEIRVKGILDPSWSDWFGGFRVTVQDDETILVGRVIDQSDLHGLLGKINDLGLSLISMSRLPEAEIGVDQDLDPGLPVFSQPSERSFER
ncbi:MAG: hypothetical protein MUF84_00010 [Anaerolineae bacterium]|jgi:hypothetical protein|nr:hypothetical protein [Anaerolineae bacterium]